MIHFNDLYIHMDDGSLWNDTSFKATYNHYKWDLDEDYLEDDNNIDSDELEI